MPSLKDHHSSTLVKLLLLGDAWSGKTTALASLVTELKLNLYILDFDNKLDPLRAAVAKSDPALLANINYIPFRDSYKAGKTGQDIRDKPKAFVDSLKLLDNWIDGETNLGPPGEWGGDRVLVIDSLSRWCDLAYDFHEGLNPSNDGRAIFGAAQDSIERVLANLTSPHFKTNVIVICHGQYMEMSDGKRKIFPQGVGKALSPKIPQYFPNYIKAARRGDKRILQLRSDNMIDLGINLPESFGKELDSTDGLAKIFAALTTVPAQPEQPAPEKPKSVQLVRRHP